MLTTVLLSVRVGLTAVAVNIPIALAIEYFLTHFNFRGKAVIDGIVNLPLVMPPVTTGFILLIILGRKGLIGSFLFNTFGLRIAFTGAAPVIAAMIVSFPLIARSIRISMEMIDPGYETAARTLGAGRLSVFFRIILPLTLPGLAGGAVTAFARSLGEFGATMTFAGNIEGVTRTIPLSVYSMLQIPGKESEAAIMVTISVLISLAAMLLSSVFTAKGNRNET